MKNTVLFLFVIISADLSADEHIKSHRNNNSNDYKSNVLKPDYIELLARQIFTEETGISNFIGITCLPGFEKEKHLWSCHIRQSATKFENGKYTVNPPGVGVWLLEINFLKNTYILK